MSSTALENDLCEFCSCCGSVMPLPTGHDPSAMVRCNVCAHAVPLLQFNGVSSSTTITFNSREALQELSKATKANEALGPVVERKCWKCSFDKMYYKTLQTRSADEGQTVFYYCVKCGAQENENS